MYINVAYQTAIAESIAAYDIRRVVFHLLGQLSNTNENTSTPKRCSLPSALQAVVDVVMPALLQTSGLFSYRAYGTSL